MNGPQNKPGEGRGKNGDRIRASRLVQKALRYNGPQYSRPL